MNTTQDTSDSKYTAKYTADGRCEIVRTEDADLPFIRVRWYDGGIWASGVCAIRAGETPVSAAERAFDAKLVVDGPLRGKRGSTVEISPVVWR